MAGEHILKLLIEENARIELGDRWLIVRAAGFPLGFNVYEQKSPQEKVHNLLRTESEKEACKILKGE